QGPVIDLHPQEGTAGEPAMIAFGLAHEQGILSMIAVKTDNGDIPALDFTLTGTLGLGREGKVGAEFAVGHKRRREVAAVEKQFSILIIPIADSDIGEEGRFLSEGRSLRHNR